MDRFNGVGRINNSTNLFWVFEILTQPFPIVGFWRSIKYEDIYLKSYDNPLDIEKGIEEYILRHNNNRPHQSLSNATPEEVYSQKKMLAA